MRAESDAPSGRAGRVGFVLSGIVAVAGVALAAMPAQQRASPHSAVVAAPAVPAAGGARHEADRSPLLDGWVDEALIDVEDVFVAFGDDGSMSDAQRERLQGFGRLVEGLPLVFAAAWCEPRGPDQAERLVRAAREALDAAGLASVTLRPSTDACRLPGTVLLRPAG